MHPNNKIKVCHVAYSDTLGGACRAAFRLYSSFKTSNNQKIISSMRVIKKFSEDQNIIGGPPKDFYLNYFFQKKINKILRLIYSLQYPKENVFSIAWPDTGLGNELNRSYFEKKIDIVNLHYLADNTISINEIGNLKMPVVWRLNDQWPFCSCEHYSGNQTYLKRIDLEEKYINNYSMIGNNNFFNFFDLKKIIFNKKKNAWRKKIHIVAPSNWIASSARKSFLFKDQPIKVIPSALDLDFWSPLEKKEARNLLNLPINKKLILFGALGGTSDLRKGGDLLLEALYKLKSNIKQNTKDDIELIIFGQDPPKELLISDFKIHFPGKINKDELLKLYYSASDLFILPSRQDNLPGTGIESQACGTPVIAFDIGGLSDVIEDQKTGILIKPFDTESLSAEIYSLLMDESKMEYMKKAARSRAISLWDQKLISQKYEDFYSEIHYKNK